MVRVHPLLPNKPQTANDRYNDKRYVNRVSFNVEKEKEKDLIAKVNEIENFSEWVKKQLASQ